MSSFSYPGRVAPHDPDLSDRLRDVFAALVGVYGRTAHPVGSEALARDGGVDWSPATLRNDLAELESLGLLERTHASAGRVPTPFGYELYVRALLQPAALPAGQLEQIRRALGRSSRDVEALLHEASRILSTLTQQLGLAVARSLDADRLRRLDLESLGEQRVLLVLGLDGGAAQTLVLELESPLDRAQLEVVSQVLRERLLGLTIAEVLDRMVADRELVRRTAVRLVVRAAVASWGEGVATPLISAGTARMAQQAEFARSEQLSPVLRAVETGIPLDRLMVAGVEGQTAVCVGLDPTLGLEACSLVSFTLPGQVRGGVGVLGPLRMNYADALAAVDAVGSHVAELLQS